MLVTVGETGRLSDDLNLTAPEQTGDYYGSGRNVSPSYPDRYPGPLVAKHDKDFSQHVNLASDIRISMVSYAWCFPSLE